MADNEVERSTVVAASPDDIYPHLVDFHRWQAWSPWEGRDPAQQRTYEGPDAGPGARYAWKGNRKVGQGSMEIVQADEPAQVVIDLNFLKPFASRNTTTFQLRPEAGGTRVTWSMTAPKTLMSRVFGVFMSLDKMVGKDFEQGLSNLKGVAEPGGPAAGR